MLASLVEHGVDLVVVGALAVGFTVMSGRPAM